MGLDISAFNNLKKVSDDSDDGWHLSNGDGFPYQQGDLEIGVYEVDESPYDFRSGYVRWSLIRERLAELAGWPEWKGDISSSFYRQFPRQAFPKYSDTVDKYTDLPLLPLISFTGCDGVICNSVCKQISKDFEDIELAGDDEFLQPLKDIFKWAADNDGVVCFH